MIAEAMDGKISVTTKNIFPDGKMQQNSTGDTVRSGLLLLSKSDEKVHLVPSRYLRPSMASCHDYCKYGKKHDSKATSRDLREFLKKKLCERRQDHLETPCVEERRLRTVTKPKMETESKSESGSSEKSEFSKPRSLFPSFIKKNVSFREKKSLMSSRFGNEVKNLNQDDEKKTKVMKKWIPRQPKSTPDKPVAINLPSSEDTESVTEPSVAPKEIKSYGFKAVDSEVHCVKQQQQKIKQKAPLPLKHVDVSVRSAMVLKTKTPLIRRSLSRRKSSRSLIARSSQEKKLTKSLGTSRFEGVASKAENNLRSKAPHLRSSISQFARRNQESITRSLDLSEIEDNTVAPAETLKTRTLVKSVSKLKPSWCPIARTNQESKMRKSLGIERKPLKVSPASFIGISSLKRGTLSSLKHATSAKSKTNKVGGINSKKKSEDSVFGTDHENEHSKSATNKLSSMEIEDNGTIEGNTKIEVSRGQYTRGVRRTSTTRAEESTSSTPYKLKYRRRKSIDFRSTDFRSDSIGARRLGYRTGKKATDSPNGSKLLWRRSFKKKDMDLLNSEAPTVVLEHRDVDEEEVEALFRTRKMSGKNPSSGRFSWRRSFKKKKKEMESSDSSKLPNSEPQIVVLKHQDAEKKEAQALFNHVIEETASKLVESRTSKVKALVGAFESVISLQERKPASAV